MLTPISFVGAALRKRSFVSAYAQAMWYMVGFQLGAGAFFIYTLYRQKEVNIQKCIDGLKGTNLSAAELRNTCIVATRTWKIVYIIVFVIALFLHGCESSSRLLSLY